MPISVVREVPYKREEWSESFKGSYGTVYRATRWSSRLSFSRQPVFAIKEIQAVSLEEQLKVAQEIKFLRQFRHPNILKLEEAFTIDALGQGMFHTIRLVTKPWAPVSLHHFIHDLVRSEGVSTICPWFRPQALAPWPWILLGCLRGVEYLHTRLPHPIRHKDIKPQNILLSFEPQLRQVRPIIIDFGISKEHIDSATTANTGTYEYKAPEQINNQEPTLASDIFSLGCCFSLIEGIIRPWPCLGHVYDAAMGQGTCQFAHNVAFVNEFLTHYDEALSINNYFYTNLRALVENMLAKEPSSRPTATLAARHIVASLDWTVWEDTLGTNTTQILRADNRRAKISLRGYIECIWSSSLLILIINSTVFISQRIQNYFSATVDLLVLCIMTAFFKVLFVERVQNISRGVR